MVKMELCDILVLLLCDNLLRVLIIFSCGLEVDRIVRVNGIVWCIMGLLYCSCKKINIFSILLLDD